MLSPSDLQKSTYSPWKSIHLRSPWHNRILFKPPQSLGADFGDLGAVEAWTVMRTQESKYQIPRQATWAFPLEAATDLQQWEADQEAGVKLFHVVEKFNQVHVSLAQPVAHKVVLSVAL